MSLFKDKYANDVFISYRHEGGIIAANHLAEKLKKDGYTVTFDKESLRAGRFDEQILKYINGCKDFIVILDKNVFEKTLRNEPEDWLRRELAHAIELGKNIIPVTLNGFEKPRKEQLPEEIADVLKHQFIDYDIKNFDKFYADLCSKNYLKSNSLFRKYWKYAAGIIAFLFALALMFYTGEHTGEYTQKHRDEDKTFLLFTGGGSVYKYIEEKGGVKVDSINDYPNSIYMPSATGNLWGMIAEEYFIGSRKTYKYLPIFIAADTIDTAIVENKVPDPEKINTEVLIIQLNLGNDTTCIYFDKFNNNDYPGVSPKPGKAEGGEDISCITPNDVEIIIRKTMKMNKNILYTTSQKSGTFSSFRRILKDTAFVTSIFEGGRKEYHERYPMNITDNYVILGSKYYHPNFGDINKKEIAQGKDKMFYVKDDNGSYYTKDMCLYFCAYRQGDRFIIPAPIYEFLTEKLNIEIEDTDLWNKLTKDEDKENGNRLSVTLEKLLGSNKDYIIRFKAKLNNAKQEIR